MGKGINKRWFGDPDLAGPQIVGKANFGFGVVDAWIVKQSCSRRYIFTDGTYTMKCGLTDQSPTLGQARITVVPYGGGTKYAMKITTNKVTTFDGDQYIWSSPSLTDGDAELGSAVIEPSCDDNNFTCDSPITVD
jgi:hypothetical protein